LSVGIESPLPAQNRLLRSQDVPLSQMDKPNLPMGGLPSRWSVSLRRCEGIRAGSLEVLRSGGAGRCGPR